MLLSFFWCFVLLSSQSWGYRRAFDEYAGVLQPRYPDLRFEGSIYPSPQWRSNGAQVLSYLKLVAIGCLFFCFNPFGLFGMQTPGFWLWAVACIFAFFVGNMVETVLLATGAFEVYLNGAHSLVLLQVCSVSRARTHNPHCTRGLQAFYTKSSHFAELGFSAN